MSVKKEIKEIKDNLINLRKELTPEIMAKAKLYDELMENLSNVHIKLKGAKRIITESGSKQLKIEYEIDPVILSFDDNDKPIYNPSFYGMNVTNLVSVEDMSKISKAISRINFKEK